ncbi:hypothetical protein [Ureibacillus chungkukjangi]|uniref:Uncharacterized protein n=1 Tax=Ureibacillus chungkukjangi TaxID=1202712 RepID=A0A318TR94_9BACL|nr:hypothetical protein [Ureibacillus chungkukjangi]MCM3387376.1 hypothetical protein [Ureibacillus chungkukjangi]PYF06863.1 hypothetical protein BJ095_10798 [Ureibacillus chungkukjangi]
MNSIENKYGLTEQERKQIIAEIMPILEERSREEIEHVLHLIVKKGTKPFLNLPIKRYSQPSEKI